MASDDSAQHRRNQSDSSAIQLQNLSSNGTHGQVGGLSREESHRRTLSDRGRELFRAGRSNAGNDRAHAPYTPIQDGSPSPPPRGHPTAFVTTPSGQHRRVQQADEGEAMSPIADRGAFQSAIGFAGLSFTASQNSMDNIDETEDDTPPRPRRSSRATPNSLPTVRTVSMTSNSSDDMVPVQLEDGPAYFTSGTADEDDTLPLTDPSRLQPSVAATQNSSPGQRHDRQARSGSSIGGSSGLSGLSGLSVRFSPSRQHRSTNSRLGDDLNSMEMGSRTTGSDASRSPRRKSSLSPGGDTLHRTGTMFRNMSQRVVNLSNESEPVERMLRRRSSVGPRPRERSSSHSYREGGLDGNAPSKSSSEKAPSFIEVETPPELPAIDRNPLRGKSLGIFSPESRIRRGLLEFLVHPFVEPLILLLIVVQTVILAVDASFNVENDPRPTNWGTQWSDYIILAIFIIYTLEIAIKMIVSGFVFNPVEYSTIDREIGIRAALKKKADGMFTLHRESSKRNTRTQSRVPAPESLLRSFTMQNFDDVPGGSRQAQKKRLAHRAFLRHSFNRLDFVAVVSFWISFVLGTAGLEHDHQLYVFRMMSCLRILRLLGITSGTSVILRSLKRAAPTLLNVGFLIGFFWLLFSIIGVQSFKSSLRRTCVQDGSLVQPPMENFLQFVNGTVQDNRQDSPEPAGNFQFCGGWLAENGTRMPWLRPDGSFGNDQHKGFLCPIGSYCIEGDNPYNGTISFDNILQSVELVFVIMTSNTFTDIMYYLTDSDYLAAALFFAFGIIILTFWLMSLLIAVITSSFQIIREESRGSAFMASDEADDEDPKQRLDESMHPKGRVSGIKRVYQKSYWFWIIIIVFDLIVASLRHATMKSFTRHLIKYTETATTLLLVVEIFLRFASDWRDFYRHRRNWFDLFLAIITAVIQLPFIRDSGDPYAWLTVFQIVRIYRVVLAVQLTRDLILLVLRHVSGVLNLILFVFLLTFLASIFATQLYRGTLPQFDDEGNYLQVTFATIFNSFLGMYQVLSSENWTDVLYNTSRFNKEWHSAWIAAIFFIIWFMLANFVILNMFIAVIQENFDVSEDQKRLQQVKMFLQRKEMGSNTGGTLSLSAIFKFGKLKRQDPLDFGSAATEMLLQDAVVRDFLDEENMEQTDVRRAVTGGLASSSTLNLYKQPASLAQRMQDAITKRLFNNEPNPFYANLRLTKAYEELDPRTLAREVVNAAEQRKLSQREYLRRYPKYNVSLFMFKSGNKVRKFCQRIVGPGRGTRIEGVQPNPTIWYTFSAFIYAAIVGMVFLACITTPLFQLEYFRDHQSVDRRLNWFIYTDIGFAALFTVEAMVKVIADGFFWTPNAYFRSSWGFIDGVVLVTLWINVITSLYDPGSGSRAVGAFKALRALRLLNVSDSARDTFHSVVVLGGWKVLSAAFVSLSLLIPFAIYGVNLFAGKMSWCNTWQQYGVHNLTDCLGEGILNPIGYNVLAPQRVGYQQFAYDFDNFGDALFILFQVVSQEGWVDLMWSAQSITGVFTQPSWFAQQGNAVFFVVFNLLGAVFVLTLFVSVFMRNYTEQTGVAFLTSEQRSWLELRKLLRQVAPSKRPNRQKKRQSWQEWCYRRAVTKNGRWQRTITAVLIAHLILLCLEWYPEPWAWQITRFLIFFCFVLFYIANIVIRLVGLSWTRFRKSAWDLYSLISVSGTLATSIMVFFNLHNAVYTQIHKLFLVSLALLLIPRNNQLDQLFKTAAASFSSIANLLATWFVLFLVYAIAFTQTFGLTRFGAHQNNNINFRTVPKALVLLFRMSVGEQWNQIMMDYASIEPPYCTLSDNYYSGDCGSKQWAYALFVSWNIISMYIFVNLFISLIYESFSYVYQRSSGLSIISREEIRRFKQAWAEHDPNGTGYISKDDFPRFLGELSGIFEMRIYDGDFTVSQIINDCQVESRRASQLPVDGASSSRAEIDLTKLNARLAELPVQEIRRRRARMNTFYEEVLVSADPDLGIAFNALLMILAHYKVINDSKSLRLEEFLRRRARLQRVEEAVNRNIVVGFFDTLYWARRFKRILEGRKSARMIAIPTFGVPEILVQDEGGDDVTPKPGIPGFSITPVDYDPADTAETLSPTRGSGEGRGSFSEGHSPSSRFRSGSIQLSPVSSPTREDFNLTPSPSRHRPSVSGSSIQPDWHFAAAMEGAGASGTSPPASPGFGPRGRGNSDVSAARSRAGSAVSQVFQDSAWGQSLQRSVTQHQRGGSGSRSGSGEQNQRRSNGS
ncbi:unnamed protein product [Zymoseptoria tritici ST99CH_1E4]|uniref:Calcium-channel protein CCH1 n=1 Tax=Zymoseptoria tritici ST99CH_1E4 TaxID=1276532 RepID=A0A2H1FNR8_ZYMTR|nr:unnamed protein product [Zymoseptoria tritici ST99CH_1E4]